MKNWLFDICIRICSYPVWHWRLRRILYSLIGISIPKTSSIHSGCFFSGNRISVGEYSYVNKNCFLDCSNADITIGNYVGIAFNVKMYTTNHDYTSAKKRTGSIIGKKIVIEDGAWIGGGSIICPGVRIGRGGVIAAGSVVVSDCLANCLYAGNPAKKIKELDAADYGNANA